MSIPVAVVVDPTMSADAEVLGEITNGVRVLTHPARRTITEAEHIDSFGTPVEVSPRRPDAIARALPTHDRAYEASHGAIRQEMQAFREDFLSKTHLTIRVPRDMAVQVERNGRPVYVEGDIDIRAKDSVFVAIHATSRGRNWLTMKNCTEALIDSSLHQGHIRNIDVVTARFANRDTGQLQIGLDTQQATVRMALHNAHAYGTGAESSTLDVALNGHSRLTVRGATIVRALVGDSTRSQTHVSGASFLTHEAPPDGEHQLTHPRGGQFVTNEIQGLGGFRQVISYHQELAAKMLAHLETYDDPWEAANVHIDSLLHHAREAVMDRLSTPPEPNPGDGPAPFSW